jgi:hypothetical protein
MALSLVARSYSSYPLGHCVIKDTAGNRARVYANAQGTAVFSATGEVNLDSTGSLSVYLADDRTYTITVYDAVYGAIVVNEQLVDPGAGAGGLTTQQSVLSSQGAIPAIAIVRTAITSGVTIDTTNTGLTQLTVKPTAGTVSVYSGPSVGSLTLVEAVTTENTWMLQSTDVVIQITLGVGAAGTYSMK